MRMPTPSTAMFTASLEHRRARWPPPRAFLGSVLLCAGLTAAPAGPALAQQSRSEEIAQQQAEKSKRLTPSSTGLAERIVAWAEDHFTDPDTVYLTFGGVYPSAGLAPGIAYRDAIGLARLDVGGAYSTRSYSRVHATLAFPELAGDRLAVEMHARRVDATEVPFYGSGNDSRENARGSYGLRSVDLGGVATVSPRPWYRFGGGIRWRHVEDRRGGGTRPSIDTLHSPDSAPALFSSLDYLQTTAVAAIDWRESSGYTRSGGLYSLSASDFRESDDQFGFRRLEAEVQQYVPLLNEHWVLAFRALAQTTTTSGGQEVPYHFLPSLGGARMHRGYGDFRFQDRHLLFLSGEYRWLPSRVLDMALFVDAGQVASTRRDFDLDRFKTAYGLGARIHGPTVTPLRLDIAHGREGFRVHITGGVAF
jgi:Omp85 superfamily domain